MDKIKNIEVDTIVLSSWRVANFCDNNFLLMNTSYAHKAPLDLLSFGA